MEAPTLANGQPAIAEPATAEVATYEQIKRGALVGGQAMLLRYAAVGLLSLAGTTELVRLLGPADWAIVSVGYFLVVFLDNTFGTTLAGALVLADETPSAARVSAAAALMRRFGVATAVLLLVAAFPAAHAYGRAALGFSLAAVAVCGIVYASRATSLALTERKLDYRTVATAEFLDQVAFYALAIPAVLLGGGLVAALAALAVRGVLPAVLIHRRNRAPLLGRWQRDQARTLLDFATPNAGAAILILLHGLVPLLFLNAAHGSALGFIWTASTITGYAATMQVISQRLGFASLSRLTRDSGLFEHATRRSVRLSTFVVVLAAGPLGALAPLWVPRLFGARWHAAVFVMAWMGAATILMSIANVATATLNARGRTRAVFRLNLFGTVSYVALSAVLVHWSILLGIPIALVISRAIAGGFALALLKPLLGLRSVVLTGAVLVGSACAVPLVAESVRSSTVIGGTITLALAGVWIALHRSEARFLLRRGR